METVTEIGKIIFNSLKGVVDGNVYPLVAEQSTKFPFIIYRTSASRPAEEKDSVWCAWEYEVVIDIVDVKYDSMVEIGDRCLDELHALDENFYLDIMSVTEDWRDDAYVREITVRIRK